MEVIFFCSNRSNKLIFLFCFIKNKGGDCYLINDKETCQCDGSYYGNNCELETHNVTTHFCLNKTCFNGLKKKKSFYFYQKSLKNKFNIKKEVLVSLRIKPKYATAI